MGRLLWMLLAGDRAIDSCVRWVAEFCADWFSWSQVWLERGLIVLISVLSIVSEYHYHIGEYWPLITVVFAWAHYRKRNHPDAKLWPDLFRILRFLIVAMSQAVLTGADIIIGFMLKHQVSWIVPVWAIVYVFTWYLIDIKGDDGQKGRKRKAALEKVIEMFGTSWMPRPEGA